MDILGTLLDEAYKGYHEADTDYIGDGGLRYCGMCRTPKQAVINILGSEKIVPVACKCAEERYKAFKENQENQAKQQRISELKAIGIKDSKYLGASFDMDDGANPKLTETCKRYVEKFAQIEKENIGLMLYGESDTGKTFMASCIANELIKRQKSCMIVSCVTLVSEIQADFGSKKDEILRMISTVKLLILDDFGVERQSEYVKQTLYEIIDARYRSKKPLIITTNIAPNELKEPPDLSIGRTYDRIIEMCTPILVQNKPRRKLQAVNKYKQAKELLGI